MLRVQIRRYGRWVLAIAALIAVGIVSGTWILVNQRLQTPLEHRYTVRVEFASTAGLSPGLGNPVDVSGVRVGDIGNVALANGRAQVELRIDPGKLPHVYRDASAMLVPNTPLQDLQANLEPPAGSSTGQAFSLTRAGRDPRRDNDGSARCRSPASGSPWLNSF